MAHFAKINPRRIVTQVIVADESFIENLPGNWIQTSYTGEFRKNYASVGHIYDFARDAFYAPQPFASWTLNENTCQWEAPVTYPTDGQKYKWNEETTNWELSPES